MFYQALFPLISFGHRAADIGWYNIWQIRGIVWIKSITFIKFLQRLKM